ncbi:phage portal protein [Caproicibacterium lactatifermentans]|uniref:Phage portal protein n=1 Tax=Caproicibacterium lactatifermentans TaxID=2666138 RepID=A0A859DN33_9FIRM|nr:phage portal protein [Caproicibacterium lactatifermentans]QKN23150.1 phage portal protein [Caproicibacterium lactatifermentans]
MSIFSKLFHSRQPPKTAPAVLTGSPAYFTPFSGNAYESDVFRAAVDAIARHGAKLHGSHIIRTADGRQPGDDNLNYLLGTRPNPYMSAYDALYKLITHFYAYNDSFGYIQRGDAGIAALYPLDVSGAQFVTDPTDTMYIKFFFQNGKQYILPYSDIIHLRRHFNRNDLLGDDNSAILPAVRLAQTQSDGIVSGIKQGASLRGILKYNQVLAPEKMKQERDAFTADFLNISNNGGVAVTDSMLDFVPLDQKPYSINKAQMDAAKSKIYEYLGISQKIVDSTYSEQEGTAFYESVIEPLAAQMAQEFTAKIFTPIEQQAGNRILFEGDSMEYASYGTRVTTLKESVPFGLFTVDEARQILNMKPIGGEEGKKRLQTLNVVQADKANQYQGVQKK